MLLRYRLGFSYIALAFSQANGRLFNMRYTGCYELSKTLITCEDLCIRKINAITFKELPEEAKE